MGRTLTFLICLVVVVHSLPQGNLDDLIRKVFNIGNESSQTESQSNPSPTQDEEIDTACTLINGKPGKCVLYHLCGANNSPLVNRAGFSEDGVNEEFKCASYLDVCCDGSYIETQTQPQTKSNSGPTQDEGIGAACTQENGQPGKCVLYYLCGANNSVITDGVGLLDIRINEASQCASYLDVCCDGSYIETQTQPQTQSNSGPTQDEGIGAACTQENGQPGECVQYYLCDANNSIITDGVGLLDIRISEASECPSYLDVCCGSPNIRDTPILLPTTPRPTPKPGGNEYDVISGCGQRNPDGVGFRIIGDTENKAAFGEFPWMVAIFREELITALKKKINVYICGGSLIHPKVVMTIAHCVAAMSGTPKLKIRAGDWDVQSNLELFPHQDINVLKILIHEQYNSGNLHNDIALLILESPVTYAENIGIVCLPPENEEPPLNAECYVSSWGRNAFENNVENTGILTRTNLTVIPRNKCQEDLRKTRLGNKFMLHRTFICAGDKIGKNTCREHRGSPLVCPMPGNPEKYMQSGIAAWSINCREGKNPRAYAHVALFTSWINEQLHLNNINDMNLYKP